MSQQKHTAEFESCVEQVMEQGHDKGSAFAICTDSFKKAGKPIFVGESETQKLHLFCESFKLEGNKVSGVAIHPKKIFHPEEDMIHVYLREELTKAAPTGAGKPFGIDHVYILPPPNLLTKSWYGLEEDGICFEGLVDDHIAEQIRRKEFKGISIELNWLRPGGSIEYVNGVAARNFELTSVHFLKRFPPGDPDAYVKLWEQIREQLVVGPPLPLDQRVDALEQRIQELLNQINVLNAKLEVLTGTSSSPSATALPAQPGASQTIGAMKMSEQNQNQEPHKCPEGQVLDPETRKCVPKTPKEPTITEQQGNGEAEKDEHGCLIGKERYDEENDKCVPITAEGRASFLEAKLRLKEQEGELTADQIKAKIADLTKKKVELDAKLYPESELSEDEKTAVRAEMDILWAEIDAYEQALKAKIAAQAVPSEQASSEGAELKEVREAIVALRKKLVETEAKVFSIEKQKRREGASWKERHETLREAVKGAIPLPRIWKSWTPGPQRYVQENLKILRESES